MCDAEISCSVNKHSIRTKVVFHNVATWYNTAFVCLELLPKSEFFKNQKSINVAT